VDAEEVGADSGEHQTDAVNMAGAVPIDKGLTEATLRAEAEADSLAEVTVADTGVRAGFLSWPGGGSLFC
jgi:hypothetical protein